MISIAEAISDLLYVRDTVVVPGLGAFVKKSVAAKVNPVANYFAMPSSLIEFDSNLREDNDLVVNYIAENNDVPEDEARRLLAMFVSDCFNSLKAGKMVVLSKIGTLFGNGAGDIAFKPDETVNYNADAFGLCDFTPKPVLRSKTKEEIKEEIERQQKDKNTPVTVDEKEVHKKDEEEQKEQKEQEDDGTPRRSLGWLWVLLGLLLAAGVVFGLHYFKVIDLNKLLHGKPNRVIEIKPGAYSLPIYTMDWDEVLKNYKETWKPAEPEVIENTDAQVPTVQTPVETKSEANIRLIAGCFDLEENAANMVNTLKSKGYSDAFYEPHYKQWYVSIGRYATMEEATAALREVRAKDEYKAWIKK